MADSDSISCSHLDSAGRRDRGVRPSAQGCVDCLAAGGEWVHLRLCLTCGHVGCCDQSPNRHSTRHYHDTKHPVIRSYEPGEPWPYCYLDDVFLEEIHAFDDEVATTHYFAPQ